MPKRKHDDKDSLSDIMKKIRRLERKLLKGRRRSSSSSSDSSHSSSKLQDETNSESENVEDQIQDKAGPSNRADLASVKSVDAAGTAHEILQAGAEDNQASGVAGDQQTQELDETVLEILGTDPSSATVFGKEIQKDLAIRFEFIATSGLSKELRKELLESHLPPGNCKLIDAPTLNAELKAAVTEAVVKRDKAIQTKQKQISSAIACLSDAITLILSQETKDPTILKLLMDAGRILCDSQHNDSITRRNFILAVLKKELKDQMQSTKIDSLLFGQELADTIKTAKAINKSGAELKSVTPYKGSANKPKPPPQSNKNLNWKAPASNRRQSGYRRTKESASSTKHRHTHSYRTSQPNTSRGRR